MMNVQFQYICCPFFYCQDILLETPQNDKKKLVRTTTFKRTKIRIQDLPNKKEC
jgi:hypothetical protein